MEHKNIFANNLKRKMKESGITRKDICDALGLSYFTVTDWVNAKKMPRMDKVEKLANYFGCLKSDLIEEKTEEQREMQKKNDILADIILQLREDNELRQMVEKIANLDAEKRAVVNSVINAFSIADK